MQRKHVTNTDRRHDVADVGWIERATQNADSLTSAAHGRSLGAGFFRVYRAPRGKTPTKSYELGLKTRLVTDVIG